MSNVPALSPSRCHSDVAHDSLYYRIGVKLVLHLGTTRSTTRLYGTYSLVSPLGSVSMALYSTGLSPTCHLAPSVSDVVTLFYSARNARIASALLATEITSVGLSVCLSVCRTHAGIVSKLRHVVRCSLHRWIAKCV